MDHSADTDQPLETQVSELQAALRDKEELVAALTERLEQAAEQLDRIHRTGGDRGVRAGGGLPPELIEQQRALTEDLQRAVEQWEAMQAEAAVGRLESQVSELRDLVAGRILESRPNQDFKPQAAEFPSEGTEDADSPDDDPSGIDSNTYEAFKAALMEPGDNESTSSPPSEPHADPAVQEELEAIEPVDPPDSIDLESAGREDLRRAVEDRDAYITWLIKRLRIAELRTRESGDWKSLENVPEDLHGRLDELESTLEEHLRLAEVEQSVERARLAREEGRLRMREQQLEKEIKRHGLDRAAGTDSDADDDAGGAGGDSEKDRMSKWLKLLGRSKSAKPSGREGSEDA